jgi:hypothetical protein
MGALEPGKGRLNAGAKMHRLAGKNASGGIAERAPDDSPGPSVIKFNLVYGMSKE